MLQAKPGSKPGMIDYGDLTNVAYPAFDGGTAEITLTADPGFMVVLSSFDMAGWPTIDKTADVLEVFANLGSQIIQFTYVPFIEGDSGHSSFSPGQAAYELIIRFGYDWNIGIDNINFDQRTTGVNPAVPEPATMLLFCTGLAGLAVARRKKKASFML